MSNSNKVLFFMSASVAAFKACQLISRLVQDGCEVQVVTTPAVANFVGFATLEGLTGKPVLSDLWEHGRAMDHIHLTRWADSAVLCPASANTVAKLAHGLADEMVSAMALAWPTGKPFWIVPAMNHQMLSNPATQQNLATLNARGFSVLPTAVGSLACGEEGEGRMLEPEQILQRMRAPKLGRRILITGGATREPIDGIRFLSNVSTGQTAATLCEQFESSGWSVTFLHGAGSILPRVSSRTRAFSSFADLDSCLREELQAESYAAVLHCAAVSDFSVVDAKPQLKLDSEQELTLHLTPNFKILPRLREYSRNRDIFVVGFKLTLDLTMDAALNKAQGILTNAVDAIVANDWNSVNSDRSRHPGTLLLKEHSCEFSDLPSLSRMLHAEFTKGLNHDSHT